MTALVIDPGTGVRLRPAQDSDALRWVEMVNDPVSRAYGTPDFVPVPGDVSEVLEALATSRSAWEAREPGTLSIVETNEPERFLGNISWRWTTGEKLGIADIGYTVHPDARGRGVGRLAIAALAGWLLDPDGRGLARVQLDHSTENEASCKVALAAGFEKEGLRRGFLPLRGPDGVVRRHDVCLHGRVVQPSR